MIAKRLQSGAGYGVMALIAVLWVVITQRGIIAPLFLPSPQELLESAWSLITEHRFAIDIIASIRRVLVAFAASLLLGIPMALVMSSVPIVDRILAPIIDFIRYLPIPALVPLMILFFGIGETAKIVLLFVGTFFQLVVLILDDLRDVPTLLLDLSYTLHLRPSHRLAIKLHSIAPQLYDNCRVTIGWCWSYVIIAELVASQTGIGHMIKEAQRFSNTADVFIGIITIGLIGLCTDSALKKLSPRFFPYRASTTTATSYASAHFNP